MTPTEPRDRDPCICRPAPVVPDSTGLRERVRFALMHYTGTHSAVLDAMTDAVLAVVRPTVSAEQEGDRG